MDSNQVFVHAPINSKNHNRIVKLSLYKVLKEGANVTRVFDRVVLGKFQYTNGTIVYVEELSTGLMITGDLCNIQFVIEPSFIDPKALKQE